MIYIQVIKESVSTGVKECLFQGENEQFHRALDVLADKKEEFEAYDWNYKVNSLIRDGYEYYYRFTMRPDEKRKWQSEVVYR